MKTFKSILQGFRLLRDVAKASPWRLPLEFFSVIAAVLNSMLVRVYLVKLILDDVVAGEFMAAVRLIVIAAVGDFILSAYESWMSSRFRPCDGVRLHERFQGKLYRRAAGVELRCYDDPEYFDSFIMAAKNSDSTVGKLIGSIREFMITVAEIIISGGFILSGLSGLLLVVLVPSVLYILVSGLSAKARVGISAAMNPQQKRMEYVKRVFFSKESAVDMRTTGLKKPLLDMLDDACDDAIRDGKKYTDRRTWYSILQGGLFYFQYISIIAVLAWSALETHDISVGDFSLLMSSALALGNNLRFFGQTVGELAEYGLFSEYYYQFLKLPARTFSAPDEEYRETRFQDVSFTYPAGTDPVFRDLTFRLQNHEKIAVVGPNGAGKSTLVSLMLGFYPPDEGEALLNDRQLTAGDKGYYSLIFQDSRLYPFTVAENLLLRSPSGEDDRAAVKSALEKVHMWERVDSLPLSMDTPLTKEFESGGVVFSGGEAQRIMLARALLQRRSVYIMDEPTAAQDPKSESELNRLFTELMRDETVMLITHRLSTLPGIDYIYLMDEGRMIESGTHEELMALGGRYHHIYTVQAELFSMEE